MFRQISYLGAGNTPLQYSPEITAELGVGFFIKREDLCGKKAGLFCSDARKVSFLMADIATAKPDTLVILTYPNSTFTVALVKVAARLGIHCVVVYVSEGLATADNSKAVVRSTLLMLGAELYSADSEEQANALISQFPGAHVIKPEGHESSAVMGGYSLMDELFLDFQGMENRWAATIYVGSNMGVTQAGMIASAYNPRPHYDHSFTIKGVVYGDANEQLPLVATNHEYLRAKAQAFDAEEWREFVNADPECSINVVGVEPLSDFNEQISLIRWFYRHTGLIVPFHALATLHAALKDEDRSKDKPIVFVLPSIATPLITQTN